MKKYLTFISAAFLMAACNPAKIEPTPAPETPKETIEFTASTIDPESKVAFEYTDGLRMKWEGNETLDVYIQKADGTCDGIKKGTLYAVEGTLSDDHYSLMFQGEAESRQNPDDKFVLAYTGEGSLTRDGFNWTRQTLSVGDDNGLSQLKRFTPITWTNIDGEPVMTKHSSVIKFVASNLPKSAKVKSVAIASNRGYIFPTNFDFKKSFTNTIGDGNEIDPGAGQTIVYAFTDAQTDANGAFTAFLAAPVISAVDKNVNDFTVQVVCEDATTVSTKKATNNITSATFMSAVKLYNLKRDAFEGAVNPATVIGGGNPSDPNDPLNNTESITGQWDKFGSLSNDIYGVLDKGKNITEPHKAMILSAYTGYTTTATSSKLDGYIHPVMARLAGAKDEFITNDVQVAAGNEGPQYISPSACGTADSEVSFNNIVLKKDTEVYMTFINTLAWNYNTIGYYCYPSSEAEAYNKFDKFKDVHKYVVIPSTSAKNEEGFKPMPPMTTAQLLYPNTAEGSFSIKFPAGTVIGLFDIINGLDTSKDFSLKEPSGDIYYNFTNIAWNQVNNVSGRTFPGNSPYLNFIGAARVKVGESIDNHSLIYGLKDKPALHTGLAFASFTNPIILIYTSEENAIDWNDDYWPTDDANKYVCLGGLIPKDCYTIQSTLHTDCYAYANPNSIAVINNASSTIAQREWVICESKSSISNVQTIDEDKTYYLYSRAKGAWLTNHQKYDVNWMNVTTSASEALPVKFEKADDGISYKIIFQYNQTTVGYACGNWTSNVAVFGTKSTYDENCNWLITLY